jgi:hypothetical protein
MIIGNLMIRMESILEKNALASNIAMGKYQIKLPFPKPRDLFLIETFVTKKKRFDAGLALFVG